MMVNGKCRFHSSLLCFNAAPRNYTFAQNAQRLKTSYIHNTIETLLSTQYREIDDTVTSLTFRFHAERKIKYIRPCFLIFKHITSLTDLVVRVAGCLL